MIPTTKKRPPRKPPGSSLAVQRVAAVALLLLAAVLFLSKRRVDGGSGSTTTTRSTKTSSSEANPSPSFYVPPAVTSFHSRLDDMDLGSVDAAVVAASLREALAGRISQSKPSASPIGDVVDAGDADSLADPDLSASFSALLSDVRRASFVGSSSAVPECRVDPTLPALSSLRVRKEKRSRNSTPDDDGEVERPRLLLAANLKDASSVLPHWIVSALATGASLPREDFFLSVVESGSGTKSVNDREGTRAWLSLLSRLASLSRVRAWVAADARAPRRRGEDRISHLAALRNDALLPLWSGGPSRAAAAAEEAEVGRRTGGKRGDKSDGSPLSDLLDLGAARAKGESGGLSPFEANRVAFANDVFFCPTDVARLVAHTSVSSSSSPLPVPSAGPADLACGLDLYEEGRTGVLGFLSSSSRGAAVGPWRRVPGEEMTPWGERGPTLDVSSSASSASSLRRRRKRWEEGGGRRRRGGRSDGEDADDDGSDPSPPPKAFPHDSPLLLYDVWVSRDADGVPLSSRPPFVRHRYSVGRASRGLPFPVSCCWNGLAVFGAGPFPRSPSRPPLRFRSAAGAGDCPGSSECSLFCSDLHERGRWRAVVDPGVRVSYEPGAAEKVAAASSPSAQSPLSIPSVPFVPWERIASSDPVDWSFAPAKFHTTCCPKGDARRDEVENVGSDDGGADVDESAENADDDVVHWERCRWGHGVDPLERRGLSG